MPLPPTEISLRLKAGRMLAGGLDPDGRPKALPVEELVKREPLRRNRIGQNRIEELEQARIDEPRSMELEKIADALDLPHAWFVAEDWRALISEEAAADADPEVERLRAERSVLKTTIAQVREELEGLRKRPPLQESGAASDE